MKLYYSPGACSLSPNILIQYTGSQCELIRVDLRTHKTVDGTDFYTINPKGQVPFLVLDDGTTLSEGAIIAQYIVEHAKNTQLLPPVGEKARYKVLEWQNYISSELHKGYSPLFNPNVDANTKTLFAQTLVKKIEWVDSQLNGKEYLTGNQFTVADAYLYTVLGWAKMVKLDISGLVNINNYISRVAALPAVQAAHQAEKN